MISYLPNKMQGGTKNDIPSATYNGRRDLELATFQTKYYGGTRKDILPALHNVRRD